MRYKERGIWDPLIELFWRKLANWKQNLLSKGGKLTLVKSTLSNIPIYFLSALTIPVMIAKNWKEYNAGSFGGMMKIERDIIW